MIRFIAFLLGLVLFTGSGLAHEDHQHSVPLSEDDRVLLKEYRIDAPFTFIEAHGFSATLMDGTAIELTDYHGKVVVLNFWATWCTPCLKEMPDLEELWNDSGGKVVVVAISMGETEEKIRKFLKKHHFSFPIIADTDMKIVQLYGVKNLPITYLVDPDGVIIGRAIGPRDWAKLELVEFLKSRISNNN